MYENSECAQFVNKNQWKTAVWEGGGGGRNELLLDGNNYQDSNYTEWKLVMSNMAISNFETIPTPVIFLWLKKPQYTYTSKALGRSK